MMPADGSIQIRNNPGTGYEVLKAGAIYSNDSPVWTTASLTNLNQLTNGPGYITDGNTNWDNSYGYITNNNANYLVTA